MLEKCSVSFFEGCLPLLKVSSRGQFAAYGLKKIEAFETSFCTWTRQISFLCDILVQILVVLVRRLTVFSPARNTCCKINAAVPRRSKRF